MNDFTITENKITGASIQTLASRFKPKSDLETKVLTAVGSSGADNADMLGTADV